MLRKLGYQIGVPVWFLLVGTIGNTYPPSNAAVTALTFVMALVVVPLLALVIDAYFMRRGSRRPTPAPGLQAASLPR